MEQSEGQRHQPRPPAGVGVAHAVVGLDGPCSASEARGEGLQEIGLDQRVGVDHHQGVGPTLVQAPLEGGRQGIALAHLPGVSPLHHLGASYGGELGRGIGAVVGDHQDSSLRGRPGGRGQAGHGRGDVGTLIMGRDDDVEAQLWSSGSRRSRAPRGQRQPKQVAAGGERGERQQREREVQELGEHVASMPAVWTGCPGQAPTATDSRLVDASAAESKKVPSQL